MKEWGIPPRQCKCGFTFSPAAIVRLNDKEEMTCCECEEKLTMDIKINKKAMALELIDQIISLSEAQDREFTKLIEQYNTNSIYNKKPVPNGKNATTFHMIQLKELLNEILEEKNVNECLCKPDKNIKVPKYVYLTEGYDPAQCDKLNQ